MPFSSDLTGSEGEYELESDISISDVGVCGNESELAECGNRRGKLGIVNGICSGEDDSYPLSRLNVGDVGDVPGVLRRTYVEMGVSAARSLDEPYVLTERLLLQLRRGRDDVGRGRKV